MKLPEGRFRDNRLDQLAGIRGPEDQRAVRLGELDALAREVAYSSIGAVVQAKSASLAADVTLTITGTWYDGPEVALKPGVWVLNASALHTRGDATGGLAAIRLMVDTTVIGAAEGTHPAAVGASLNLFTTTLLRVLSNTTVKLQMRSAAGGAGVLMKASAPYVSADLVATTITAIRTGEL